MPKLNQIIAIVNGKKAQANSVIAVIKSKLRKNDLFLGLSKTYQPKDEDGDKFPPENKLVQVKVDDVLGYLEEGMTQLWDVVLSNDLSNQSAVANVEVDGRVILVDIPVTTLMFLEKQLNEVLDVVNGLPTLDPAEHWELDSNTGNYVTDPFETAKTKKISKPVVLYEATKEHPAQVKEVNEDIVIGYWKQTKISGAIPELRKKELTAKVQKLIQAVKVAREEANGIEAKLGRMGTAIFAYLYE